MIHLKLRILHCTSFNQFEMRKYLLIIFALLLFIPRDAYSQNWDFQNIGNSFDGFKKIALVESISQSKLKAVLGVVNSSANRTLKWQWGEGNKGLDMVNLILMPDDEISPNQILLAFDEDNSYYIVNFTQEEKQIYISGAVSKNYNSFLTYIDIINLLKTKKQVHFRISTESDDFDCSFPLKGSTIAIEKSFVCPEYKKSGNWGDSFFETFSFFNAFKEVDKGKKNFIQFGYKCFEYFEGQYGKYYFTQINSIESKGYLETPTLVFKNSQGVILDEIPRETYLKNFYHFSGNPKKNEAQKIMKDSATIEIYYQAFKDYTDLIDTNSLPLEKFIALSPKELIPYFNELKRNKEFLDYVRIDESIFYEYKEEDFTFKVFTEAWGRE